MAPDFHETLMGRNFFERDFPLLIERLKELIEVLKIQKFPIPKSMSSKVIKLLNQLELDPKSDDYAQRESILNYLKLLI